MEFFLPRVLSSIEERPLPTMARRGGKETFHDTVSWLRGSPVELLDTVVSFKLGTAVEAQDLTSPIQR